MDKCIHGKCTHIVVYKYIYTYGLNKGIYTNIGTSARIFPGMCVHAVRRNYVQSFETNISSKGARYARSYKSLEYKQTLNMISCDRLVNKTRFSQTG